MITQYAFTRPFFALVTCILYYNGVWEEGGLLKGDPASTTIIVLTFTFLFVAMWGLLQLYRIFNLILQPNNVGSKFMAIKVYILLHAVQGFIFNSIVAGQEDEDKKLNIIRSEYAIICLEMMIGSLLNKYVFFKYHEYIDYEKEENQERIALEKKSYNTDSFDQPSESRLSN